MAFTLRTCSIRIWLVTYLQLRVLHLRAYVYILKPTLHLVPGALLVELKHYFY